MSHVNIIRAWKDEEYRSSLSDTERAMLPDHPAGLIELQEADLDAIAGGRAPTYYCGTNEPACQIYDTNIAMCPRTIDCFC
jgi:mersacidin/lichenicidin family type 2 lantibiotic